MRFVLLSCLCALAAMAAAPPPVVWQQAAEPLVLDHAATQQMALPMPYEAGTLEMRFKPHRDAMEPRQVLSITGGGSYQLTLSYHPSGKRWIFHYGTGKPQELIIWHDLAKPGEWNHLLLTWDRTAQPHGTLNLYLNGHWRDIARYDRNYSGPATLTLGNDDRPPAISLQYLTLYNRAFTKEQAVFMAELPPDPISRAPLVTKRLADDDLKVAQRQAQLDQLSGKIGFVIHRRGTQPREIELPEGLTAQSVRPEDIGVVELSDYAVLLFPQGPRYQLDDAQAEQIRAYVQAGGGYVGSCQGAYYASEIGLLDYTCEALNIWGLFKVRLRSHLLTDFRSGEIPMHFGNGPVMIPGPACEVVATYVMTLPGDQTPAAILTGTSGKGRVVAFGPHPLGGQISNKGTRANWSGSLLETDYLMVNALLYAAGITDLTHPKEHTP